MKTCTKCGEAKSLLEFSKGRSEGQLQSRCKICVKAYDALRNTKPERKAEMAKCNKRPEALAYAKEYRDSPDNKTRYFYGHLLRTYGLNRAHYDLLVESQGNRCAICGADRPGRGSKNWPVDHDHNTGKIRGLLCHSCNHGLGTFKDSPELMQKAAEYIRRSLER